MSTDIQTINAVPCNICGSNQFIPKFEAVDRFSDRPENFTIARCTGCGVFRTFPFLSESELSNYYDAEYWGEEPTDSWLQRSQAEKTAFLAEHGPPGGRILDIGAGAGYFLRAIDGERWERYAVENGDVAAEKLVRYFGTGRVHHGTIFDSPFPSDFFDVITFWSSLEHMNQPREALKHASRLLRSSGTLMIQVPNARSWQLEKFGANWFALDAPRHRYHFSFEILEKLLNENDLEVEFVTFASKEHNLHALRQSMKSKYGRAGLGRIRYLLFKPFTRAFDNFKSRSKRGATITLAAKKRSLT